MRSCFERVDVELLELLRRSRSPRPSGLAPARVLVRAPGGRAGSATSPGWSGGGWPWGRGGDGGVLGSRSRSSSSSWPPNFALQVYPATRSEDAPPHPTGNFEEHSLGRYRTPRPHKRRLNRRRPNRSADLVAPPMSPALRGLFVGLSVGLSVGSGAEARPGESGGGRGVSPPGARRPLCRSRPRIPSRERRRDTPAPSAPAGKAERSGRGFLLATAGETPAPSAPRRKSRAERMSV